MPNYKFEVLAPSMQQKDLLTENGSLKSTKNDNISHLADLFNFYVVNLYRRGIEVLVKDRSGKSFQLNVVRSATVTDIKNQLQDMTGFPPDQVRLIYSGYALQDERSILSYGISNGCTVYMDLRLRAGGGHILKVETSTCSFNVIGSPGSTFSSIKYSIYSETGYHPDQQVLWYKERKMEDQECLFASDFTLQLTLRPSMPLKIEVQLLDGAIRPLSVKSFDTIASIKSKVQSAKGVSIKQQRLFLVSHELNDDTTLFSNNIENNSRLTLLVISPGWMCVFILCPGGLARPFKVRPNDTITTLKFLIERELNVTAKQQLLTIAGNTLDEAKHLSDYTLKDNSIIKLEISKVRFIQLHCQLRNGKVLTLHLDDSQTVNDLKQMISEMESIPPDHQLIIFEGAILTDTKRLSECRLTDHSQVYLLGRASGIVNYKCVVHTPSGRREVIDVGFSNTIGGILEKLERDHQLSLSQEEFRMDIQKY